MCMCVCANAVIFAGGQKPCASVGYAGADAVCASLVWMLRSGSEAAQSLPQAR